MGQATSQETSYLEDGVLKNYRRADDRDLRFRLALASHQRFYKHFDPAKLVLDEDEFAEVFAPAYHDPRAHFRHLDEKGRGRVSSFEALAGCYLTARNWDESSEKLLVTALFQVFDRSCLGTLSRVETEIMFRTCAQALTRRSAATHHLERGSSRRRKPQKRRKKPRARTPAGRPRSTSACAAPFKEFVFSKRRRMYCNQSPNRTGRTLTRLQMPPSLPAPRCQPSC